VSTFAKGKNEGKPSRYGVKIFQVEEYILTLKDAKVNEVKLEADINTNFVEPEVTAPMVTLEDDDDNFDPTKE
jgi:hypothetical protein